MNVVWYYIQVHFWIQAVALKEGLAEIWDGGEILFLLYVDNPTFIVGRHQNFWREILPRCVVFVSRKTSDNIFRHCILLFHADLVRLQESISGIHGSLERHFPLIYMKK